MLEQESYEDTISRQEVLLYINKILNCGMGKKKSFEFIQKYVEKLQSVTPQPKTGHWIPVSERLPEGGIEVLLCDTKGIIYCSYKSAYDDYYYYDECGNIIENDIIAWMPLPEPYKAESEK